MQFALHRQAPSSRKAAWWLRSSGLVVAVALAALQPALPAMAVQDDGEQSTAVAEGNEPSSDSTEQVPKSDSAEPSAEPAQAESEGDATPEQAEGEKTKADESSDPPADSESKQDMSGESQGEEQVEEGHVHEVEEEPPAEEADKKPEPKPAPKEEPKEEAPPVSKKKKRVIGATAKLMEKQSELIFSARVDSGAKSCSLHIEKMEIVEEQEKMADNIGKVIKFQVKNGENKKHWLESKIAGYVIIKTSDNRERRYKVPITLRWKNMEKEVLVTLNNRDHMEYPLLLGRNFLRGDFLVDVEIDSDD